MLRRWSSIKYSINRQQRRIKSGFCSVNWTFTVFCPFLQVYEVETFPGTFGFLCFALRLKLKATGERSIPLRRLRAAAAHPGGGVGVRRGGRGGPEQLVPSHVSLQRTNPPSRLGTGDLSNRFKGLPVLPQAGQLD